MLTKPAPGASVQYTRKFLRDLRAPGKSPAWRSWTVLECDCEMCRQWNFVAVDEKQPENPARQRHINWRNLELVP